MIRQKKIFTIGLLYGSFVFAILLAGCSQPPASCPPAANPAPVALDGLADYSDAPIQFPLEDYIVNGHFSMEGGSGVFENKRHAAQDIYKPPGTPVYAIANGTISYSGPMGGYGWLITIDHPQANVYSLYGHLSTRRWRKESGDVEKGELIAYIGESDENGSDDEYGLMMPHLHFAIRAGQKADYLDDGDKRWQAGWTVACPEDIGWMQPSGFITDYASGIAPESAYRPLPKAVVYAALGLCIAALAWFVARRVLLGRKSGGGLG